MPPMGGWFSSGGEPTRSVRTNVSVIPKPNGKETTLSYTVYGASASNCEFRWKPSGGGYVGCMEARDGETLYFHEFANAMPDMIRVKKGGKNGDYMVFTCQHPSDVSLDGYVRN